MEHETAANQVASFELRKALEAYDWGEIDNICSNNVGNLSDSDISLWVRAKYMLGDFSKCYELCSTNFLDCLLYTSPSPRDVEESRMPSSA